MVGRRGFLASAALGTATLLVAGDGLLAYRAYDQGVFAAGRGPAFDAVADWRSYEGPVGAVAAAVLAASAHNTQPWMFAVSEDRIDVFADRLRATGPTTRSGASSTSRSAARWRTSSSAPGPTATPRR